MTANETKSKLEPLKADSTAFTNLMAKFGGSMQSLFSINSQDYMSRMGIKLNGSTQNIPVYTNNNQQVGDFNFDC